MNTNQEKINILPLTFDTIEKQELKIKCSNIYFKTRSDNKRCIITKTFYKPINLLFNFNDATEI